MLVIQLLTFYCYPGVCILIARDLWDIRRIKAQYLTCSEILIFVKHYLHLHLMEVQGLLTGWIQIPLSLWGS